MTNTSVPAVAVCARGVDPEGLRSSGCIHIASSMLAICQVGSNSGRVPRRTTHPDCAQGHQRAAWRAVLCERTPAATKAAGREDSAAQQRPATRADAARHLGGHVAGHGIREPGRGACGVGRRRVLQRGAPHSPRAGVALGALLSEELCHATGTMGGEGGGGISTCRCFVPSHAAHTATRAQTPRATRLWQEANLAHIDVTA